MNVMSDRERSTLEAISKIAWCNPFTAERTALERIALGKRFVEGGPVWSASVSHPNVPSPNVAGVHEQLELLIPAIHSRMKAGCSAEERAIYTDCVQYLLFQRYCREFDSHVSQPARCGFYRNFLEDWTRFLTVNGKPLDNLPDPVHVFACFRQLRIAFQHIFYNIIGNSMPAARLRASAWQSLFTHDLRRYHAVLWPRMQDFPTLITGPSGTGKELIARAIAGARYVPFDPRQMQFKLPAARDFPCR